MAEEQQLPHKLTLTERKHLTVTGVQEVMGFDESGVVLGTGGETLVIQGQGLQLKALTPEDGQVIVDGQITGLTYTAGTGSRGWFRRLLG